jgi:flagellar motility protein MotE (MotC chaperone)
MSIRTAIAAFTACAALGLVACGGEDEESSQSEESTPAQAVAEIGEVRAALDRAIDQVRAGDRQAADETLSEGYLQHFEKVEGPLEKVDEELNEGLEDLLRDDLRARVKAGAAVAEIQSMVSQAKADLATAETKLR